MPDMLVKLYDLPDEAPALARSYAFGVEIRRATAPDFFGPTRVLDSEQGHGVGTALLLRCLTAMREYGYGYAIIGSVGPVEFYQKTCNATVIPDSDPGIYKDFLRGMEKRAEKH